MKKYFVRTIDGNADTSGADCMVIENPYAFFAWEHIDDKKSCDKVKEALKHEPDVVELTLENSKTYRFTAL